MQVEHQFVPDHFLLDIFTNKPQRLKGGTDYGKDFERCKHKGFQQHMTYVD